MREYNQETYLPAAGTIAADQEDLASLARQFKDVEACAQALKGMLGSYASTLKNDALQRQAETLGAWTRINSEGLTVAARALALGSPWLNELHQRMLSVTEELQNVKNGTGAVSARKESDEARELMRIWNEVNNVLDSMERLFAVPETQGSGAGHA